MYEQLGVESLWRRGQIIYLHITQEAKKIPGDETLERGEWEKDKQREKSINSISLSHRPFPLVP